MRPTLPSLAIAAVLCLPGISAAQESATGDIVNAQGEKIGAVTLTDGPNGVMLAIGVADLPSGPHGLHIHAVGTCDDAAEGFKASGSHVNPSEAAHGLMNADGPDAGDLPNLIVHEDGTAAVEMFSPLVALTEADGRANLLDEDGSALVIHEGRDDQMSQPIGGAGARIACAAIGGM
ncbi:superoxide dismutase family protein [Mesorhizobium xinjiangense]|uniref:superoxide dismutase family protein n=1 Tax=Mesorhizobium xinjiangense TaxID=2678685 RepID=UPI0012EE5E80|nr:superoxide dismutase family protein [Mesorhizobium xinjiangense]